MKKYFTKKVIIIVLIALFIALFAAVTVTLSDTASGHIANVVNTVSEPVKKAMGSMVDSLEQLYNYLYKYDMLEAENEELKAKIAKLEQEERDFDEISDENQQLRDLLELGKRNADYEFEAVSVISWSASNFDSSFTISKGESSGLALNDCVITGSGYLIGKITELNSTSATVTTVIDPNTSVGALIHEIGEIAVAEGDFQYMQEGKMKLSYLEKSSQVMEGYTIVTSGRSGTYPKGLVIGTVDTVHLDKSGLNDFAVITPSAELDNLSMVYVVTDFGLD